MGIATIAETELAALMRAKRTLTQDQVYAAGRTRDVQGAIPPQVRFTARQGHSTASPAAH